MPISLYDAKKSLIDFLKTLQDNGEPLYGAQISYEAPRDYSPISVYGGGIRFNHTDAVAESPGVMVEESAFTALYIRVSKEIPATIEETDQIAETVLNTIISALMTNKFGGGLSWQGMPNGASDYSITDSEVTTILAVQVVFGKMITYV